MRKALAALLLTFALTAAGTVAARAEAPNVVVSIKPIHSLVSAIMQGVAEPGLIVEGAASPHTYSLKPSNAAALQDADIVFWVGHGLEAFLDKPLDALGDKATVVELDDAPGLEKLPFREGGPFEAHDDGDEHGHAHDAEEAEAGHDHAHEAEEAGHEHHHEEGETDLHLWLSTRNAGAIAAEIARVLEEKDPANAATYKENLEALNGKLTTLDGEIKETIAPIKDKPFIVFHDAYQYFEHDYGVITAGSITVSPETLPGADRLTQIRDKVKTLGATCVFAEPQFEPKLVNVVLEGTAAKSGTLDPEAATLDPGPDLYFTLMKGIATSLRECLGGAS